jgi:GTP-binding protein
LAQPGEKGQERRIRLDLILLADVALVGLPNAGKSTLISRLSAARPKVADYPFTTLNPNLGVVDVEDFEQFVVADVPGLVEGASRGVGLGHRFLRHVERTRLIVFLVDGTGCHEKDLNVLQAELEAFSAGLVERAKLVAINKTDLLAEVDLPETIGGYPVFPISALTGRGLYELSLAMAKIVSNL